MNAPINSRATNDLIIREVRSSRDMDGVRALFEEYQRWLGVDLCFQGFARELQTLPGKYARPKGQLLMASDARGVVAGGVGMRPLGSGICEMKRLYVRPAWRGQGLGRRLAIAVINEARQVGYERMRLDSLGRLQEALSLYRSMGFMEIAPYTHNPEADVVFMEFDLRPSLRTS